MIENPTRREFLAASAGLVLPPAVPAAAPPQSLDLHVVPTPIRSYRLLAMDRDADGFVWAGSIHHAIHRYDPRTGEVKTVPLPVKSAACACISAGQIIRSQPK